MSLVISHWTVPYSLQPNIVEEFADVLPHTRYGCLSRATPAGEFLCSVANLFEEAKRLAPSITVSLGANGVDAPRSAPPTSHADVPDSRSRLEHLGVDACSQWVTDGEFQWNSLPHDEHVVREAIDFVEEWLAPEEHDGQRHLVLNLGLLSCRDTLLMKDTFSGSREAFRHASDRVGPLVPLLRELVLRVSKAGCDVAMFCLNSFATGERGLSGQSAYAEGTTSFFCTNRALREEASDFPVLPPLPCASVRSLARRFVFGEEAPGEPRVRSAVHTHEQRADGGLQSMRTLFYDEERTRLFSRVGGLVYDLSTDPGETVPVDSSQLLGPAFGHARPDGGSTVAPSPPRPPPSSLPPPSSSVPLPSTHPNDLLSPLPPDRASGKDEEAAKATRKSGDANASAPNTSERGARNISINQRERKMNAMHRA